MADVFISYKSERRPAARHLAKVLDGYGYDVWYDYGLIPGDDFEPRLLAELASAKVVVVLWCTMAVRSEWVRKEAREAKRKGKYLPCWIEGAMLPEGFEGADTVNLTEWDGAPRSHVLDRLLGDIARRLGRDPILHFNRLRELDEDWRGYGAPSLAQFALGRALTPDAASQRPPAASSRAPAPALTVLYASPEGISPNLAQHWKNAIAGDATALASIADHYSEGRELPQDDEEAARFYALAAEQGHADAQYSLAIMYEQGRGVPQNEAEAARLYALAADQGHCFAPTDLGRMYWYGCGVPKDEARAARLFKLVGDRDGGFARVHLGLMYEQGCGVPKDEAEGARLLAKAAKESDAVFYVGEDYEQGRGVPVDEAVAARLYALAAEYGDRDAQNSLALMYEDGRGVPQNEAEAARLYALAAETRSTSSA